MRPSIYVKLVATALALVAAGAAAAGAIGSPPPAADKGLTNAEEPSGVEVPVVHDDDDAPDDEVVGEDDEADEVDDEADEVDDEATESDESDESDEADEPKDNHGAYVSAVAHDHTLTGREHGKAVSEVARSDAGKPNADDEDAEDTDGPGQGRERQRQRQGPREAVAATPLARLPRRVVDTPTLSGVSGQVRTPRSRGGLEPPDDMVADVRRGARAKPAPKLHPDASVRRAAHDTSSASAPHSYAHGASGGRSPDPRPRARCRRAGPGADVILDADGVGHHQAG